MSLLNQFNNTRKSSASSSKVSYTLDEILFIMKLFADGVSLDDISAVTGRSKHTLRYKFLEGEVILNGKPVIRSVKKYSSMEELFTDHGAEYLGEDDVKSRIEKYSKLIADQIRQVV